MPTFSNSPIPREEEPKAVSAEMIPPPSEEDKTVTDTAEEVMVAEVTETAKPSEVATEAPATETTAEETIVEETVAVPTETASSAPTFSNEAPAAPSAPSSPANTVSIRTTPDDGIIIRNFGKAQPEAIAKLNTDFLLNLDSHSFNRLQKLFRDTLKREPTAGELRLLDAIERAGRDFPDREAVGELYTDSPVIAETWADMMDKHRQLYQSLGVKRKEEKAAPPCTFEEALTLVGRYLHRAGRVLPVTDGLPYGGKNSDGRTVVLSSPCQEANAAAEGYELVSRVDLGGESRSVWVRKGPALRAIPEKSGDFLIHLKNADPEAVSRLVTRERSKSRSALGDIRAVSDRSLLETVLTLCESPDLFVYRIAPDRVSSLGRLDPAPLCDRPALTVDAAGKVKADYILRVPLKRAREMSDTLRELGLTATVIGQVKSNGKTTIRIRMNERDVPVAELPTQVLRAYPGMGLFRRRAEHTPDEVPSLPAAYLWRVPEAGILMAASAVTVTQRGQGYAAATEAVSSALSPLSGLGIAPCDIRLSVAFTSADGEAAPGDLSVEVLCGLYRAAAERGMAVEDPAFTVQPVSSEEGPAVTLSVTAWVGHPASLEREDIPRAPIAVISHEETQNSPNTKGDSPMNHVFEPLCKKPRAVILDTDIGPDCDDVGALVCLIDYAKKYGFPILGICNCTSNKAGTGTIDAVCRHCGIETPYLGQWSGEGFQDEPACHKYNDAVAEKFSEAYRNGTLKTADEVTFYRTLLAGAEDDSVMIITIGMFNDLAALLRSGADEISPLSGMELVKAKVNCLVSMAAILPEGRECNVISDYKAAEAVFNEWPTAVYLSDFHIGWKIMTGYEHIQDPAVFEAHPLALAYHLYTRGWTHLPAEGMNSSYDLTAIQFAVEGEGERYSLLEPVDLEFYAAIPEQPDLVDATRAIPNPEGKFRFMKKEASDEEIRDSLNDILRSY